MPSKYRVVLSDEERTALIERTTSGSDRDGRVVYHRLDDGHAAALLDVAAEHVAETAPAHATLEATA